MPLQLCYEIGSRVFLHFRESLKGVFFSAFFGSVCTEDSIFCLLSSLTSHLGNSAELIEFY